MFVFVSSIFAKTPGEFFVGKWNIAVTGMPNGDASMMVEFKLTDEGKITGTVLAPGASAAQSFTRIDAKDNEITAYWTASGYDVYVYLEKVSADEVEGNMMDMFTASGKRVKAEAKQ